MLIDKLQLFTAQPQELVDFYTVVLELPAAGQDSVQTGATRLVFLPAPAGWQGAYHFAINIPPNRFAVACDWLRQRTPLLQDQAGDQVFELAAPWNAQSVYFADSAGNILELIARRLLPDAPGPFNASQMLSISEIGLAVEDVPRTVERLEKFTALAGKPGLQVFSGQDSPDFCAVGDAHGLFIVVAQGRKWLPERSLPAAPLPLWVDFHLEDGSSFTLSGPPYKIESI